MTGIPVSKSQDGRLTTDEVCKTDKIIKSLERAPLYVNDVKSLHVSELEYTIQSMVKEHGIKIVLIDDIRMVKEFDLSALEDFAKNLDILLICIHKITKKDS